MIESMKGQGYSLGELCAAMGVSRSGLYAHESKPCRKRRHDDRLLAARIAGLFGQSRATYGTRRIRISLKRQGQAHGRRRIARLMAWRGLHPRQKRRFKPRTTNSRHDHPIAPNHLRALEQPLRNTPGTAWVSDITYIPTQEGWLYLAAEMDLASRRILGWKTSDSLEASLVQDAFKQAAGWRKPPRLHHSDRGCQYAAGSFRSLLKSQRVQPSMSRKANCYDNAAMESFWATLKTECFGGHLPATRQEAHRMVFDYIESFYNTRRIHSSLGYLSPADFEQSFTSTSILNN